MTDTPWMAPGTRSGVLLIDSPTARPQEAAAARDRLDAALGAVVDPEGPGWYRPLARLGRWWYLVCALVCAALLLLTPLPWWAALLVGLAFGPMVGGFSGAALAGIARTVSVTDEVRGAARAARTAEHPFVRTVLDGTAEMVRDIVERAPDRAAEAHARGWDVAVMHPDDPVDEPAAAALVDLWEATGGVLPEGLGRTT
ncbi:hypothetical protein [Luteimicrobium subarcticum]|uniref:Uncharacterized protein n=1 Tax=Luteimicrobium subarcticum TaxID=620910 RepID=A0A2M8WVP7_9MICO|nr:hypothetical protein [Luteimicrobium subarcticum]PJI94976.1 hypothetical protein CLV34_0828 [Luteimicrobium subarcticum]